MGGASCHAGRWVGSEVAECPRAPRAHTAHPACARRRRRRSVLLLLHPGHASRSLPAAHYVTRSRPLAGLASIPIHTTIHQSRAYTQPQHTPIPRPPRPRMSTHPPLSSPSLPAPSLPHMLDPAPQHPASPVHLPAPRPVRFASFHGPWPAALQLHAAAQRPGVGRSQSFDPSDRLREAMAALSFDAEQGQQLTCVPSLPTATSKPSVCPY
ncbi:hypothetical protein CALCODRAFT_500569 [Calocera cornea HHB12733]|uniref:Uncharacterized protein n=1 Tax=Calocera cornea HHB12733 TaxID=1353952 RepID=A0A165E1H5_9BASI|nr:hypothetical protein CALCODRAFT_500569 [Calocera cornea HHB12733]